MANSENEMEQGSGKKRDRIPQSIAEAMAEEATRHFAPDSKPHMVTAQEMKDNAETVTARVDKPGITIKWRPVVDGERLDGHGREEAGYPEIMVMTRPDKGSMLFVIQSFHYADVSVDSDGTTLTFEGAFPVRIDGGHVDYYWPEQESASAA